MTGWIAISLGDVTGIGPEVTLKALAAERDADAARYLLLGDKDHLRRLNEKLSLDLPLRSFDSVDASDRFCIVNPVQERLPSELAPGSPTAAHAALAWLSEGAQRCLRH